MQEKVWVIEGLDLWRMILNSWKQSLKTVRSVELIDRAVNWVATQTRKEMFCAKLGKFTPSSLVFILKRMDLMPYLFVW